MDADEAAGWGELAGEVVARGAGHVEQVHRAIAGRVLRSVRSATGPVSRPAQALHDGMSRLVYTSVRLGGRGAGWLGARVAASAWPHDAPSGPGSPAAATAQSTVVGLIGDRLAACGNPVARPLELRADGRDVPMTRRAVQRAWPGATGRVLVFLPGLCETEHAWRYRADDWWGQPTSTLGGRLADSDGWTPVDIRYPSGLAVTANGRELAATLQRLVEAWPVPVVEIAVVGHSMGGLVARHAVHHASTAGHAWLDRCRHVVCLGTPHGGSPLARGAARAAQVLGAVPETAGLGAVLDLRSVGIRDLERTSSVPDVAGVDVHLVVAVLARRPAWWGRELIGDLLVGEDSARGRGADGARLDAATVRTFRGLHHFDLLNHPAVDAHLRTILARPRGLVSIG